jgi:hypothetical protein
MVIILPEFNTWEVSMRPVEFIIKEGNELLTSHSGLALIGALLNRTELGKRLDATILPGCFEPKIPHSDIVKAMTWKICFAKTDHLIVLIFLIETQRMVFIDTLLRFFI